MAQMARKIYHVALIGAMLISMSRGASVADWTYSLTADINRQVQQLQAQIRQSVENSVRPALEQVHEMINNLPRDANGQIISTNGNSIVINNGGGLSRSIISGHTPNGEPYIHETIIRTVGNILYHNETIRNPNTSATRTIAWKVDLTNPNAKPEIITD